MAKIDDVVKQLQENKSQDEVTAKDTTQLTSELITSVKEVNTSLQSGFDRLSDSITKMSVIQKSFLKMPKIPGLESLKNALTDNMFVNAIGKFKDTVLSAITAPFALVKSAIESVKNTFVSVFKGIGNFLLSPFKLIGSFINKFSKGKEIELLEGIYEKIASTDANISKYITDKKNQAGDRLEAEKEAAKKGNAPVVSPKSKSLMDKLKDGFDNFILFLGGTFASSLLAIGASLLGFDDALKAAFLGNTFKNIKNTFTMVGNAIKELSIFGKLKDLLKLDKLRLFLSDGGIIGKAIRGLGSLFGGLGKVFTTLLKPLGFVVKFLRVNPITSVILTVIDGVVGFVKAFMGTEGTLGEKLMAGLEGAFLGIVKGFTGAIDFVAIKIPAWLLEKLGFEDAAKWLESHSLTSLVDPVWEGIKNWFSSLSDTVDMIINWFESKYLSLKKTLGFDLTDEEKNKLNKKATEAYNSTTGFDEGAFDEPPPPPKKNERQTALEQLSNIRKQLKSGNLNPEVAKKLRAEEMKLIAKLSNLSDDRRPPLGYAGKIEEVKPAPVTTPDRSVRKYDATDVERFNDPAYKAIYDAEKKGIRQSAMAKRAQQYRADIKYKKLKKLQEQSKPEVLPPGELPEWRKIEKQVVGGQFVMPRTDLEKYPTVPLNPLPIKQPTTGAQLKAGADQTNELKAAQMNVSAPVVSSNVNNNSVQNNTTVLNSTTPTTYDYDDREPVYMW